MKIQGKIAVLLFTLLVIGCKQEVKNGRSDDKEQTATISNKKQIYSVPLKASTEIRADCFIERKDTMGLLIIYPNFKSIDLVCGTEPSKEDTTVILFAEAAYTGQCLTKFNHANIAGDHVSKGIRYTGYRCKRNTGAFVYYDGIWQFCYQNYSGKLDEAAKKGGAAFAQELIIYKGEAIPIARKDSNKNLFRALCEHDKKLCIVESDSIIMFGSFRQKMLDYGVSNAIYLDMGSGWNYAWYRDGKNIVELHPKIHNYCTNWITFYK